MKAVALSGLFMSLAGLSQTHPVLHTIAWVGVVTNAVLVVAAMFSTKDDDE